MEGIQPLVEIHNLNLIYDINTPRETHALKDISLQIYPEEYVIFYGPSGCGKSTLLYCISGLLTPTDGKVLVNNLNITDFSSRQMADFHRKTIGIVFQAYNLIPTLSIVDNVALPQIWRGVPARLREKIAERVLDGLGLAHLIKRLPQELSGGQQQRVAIARSLVNDPPLVLGDEPVGNLDSKSAQGVLEVFSALNTQRRKTVILVTHDSMLFPYADRIVFMKDGRIVKEEKNAHKETPLPAAEADEASVRKDKESAAEKRLREFADALSDYSLTVAEVYLKEKMEDLLVGHLNGKISLDELHKKLALPLREGGLGFSNERADEFMRRLEDIIFESAILKRRTEAEFRTKPLPTEIGELRKYLLSEYGKPLSFTQIKRLDEAIGGRLRGSIDDDAFLKVVALPEVLAGVGLPAATAFNFLFKLKMVMKLR